MVKQSFFATVFHRERKAVTAMHERVTRTSDAVVTQSNALAQTINEMLRENDRVTKRQTRNGRNHK